MERVDKLNGPGDSAADRRCFSHGEEPGIHREDNPEIAVPFWQEGFSVSGIAVRTAGRSGGDDQVASRRPCGAGSRTPPGGAGFDAGPMEQVHDQVLANDRFTGQFFSPASPWWRWRRPDGRDLRALMAFSVTQPLAMKWRLLRYRALGRHAQIGSLTSPVGERGPGAGLFAGLGFGFIGCAAVADQGANARAFS